MNDKTFLILFGVSARYYKLLVSRFFKLACSLLWIALLLSIVSMARADLNQQNNTIHSAYECTQVALEEIDPSLLTKAERIALLDSSLSESIDHYSNCVGSMQKTMAGGGSGAGANNGSGDQNAMTEDGSELATHTSNTGDGNETSQGAEAEQKNPLTENTPVQGKPTQAAERGIIPPTDNDKIICKLLFQEITKTQDADMLKGLKEQYTNYKCG